MGEVLVGSDHVVQDLANQKRRQAVSWEFLAPHGVYDKFSLRTNFFFFMFESLESLNT
jgi:hypothetical protein